MMDIPYCHSQCIIIYSTDAMSSDIKCLIHKYSKAHWNIVWAYIYFLWYVFEIFHWKSDDKSPIHNTKYFVDKILPYHFHENFQQLKYTSINLTQKKLKNQTSGDLVFKVLHHQHSSWEMMQHHTMERLNLQALFRYTIIWLSFLSKAAYSHSQVPNM